MKNIKVKTLTSKLLKMAKGFPFFTALAVIATMQQPAFADLTWLACSWDKSVKFKVGVDPSSSSISYIGPNPGQSFSEKADYQYDVKGIFSPDSIQFELTKGLAAGDQYGMNKKIFSINRKTLRWDWQEQLYLPMTNTLSKPTDTANYGGQRICKKIILQGNKI